MIPGRFLAHGISAVSDKAIQIRSNLAAVQDHARSFADFTFVYPVISRRSRGLSIGVNLNPDKLCNFDCVYCEVDRSTPGKASKPALDRLRDELVSLIQLVKNGRLANEPKFSQVPELARKIKDIAFSGEGEPTMIRNFAECVQMVADVRRAERLDQTQIVLITNAAGLDKADVRRGLAILDANNGVVWGKLDAGTEAYYRRVNRSHVRLGRILRNLLETARVRAIVIQSLFLKLHDDPMPAAELNEYCRRLTELLAAGAKIREVHAYTVARPTPETFASKLSERELERIAESIRSVTGLTVVTFD